MSKKPYTPPTLTDHGPVVEKTQGAVGYTWEPMNVMFMEDSPIKPAGYTPESR